MKAIRMGNRRKNGMKKEEVRNKGKHSSKGENKQGKETKPGEKEGRK